MQNKINGDLLFKTISRIVFDKQTISSDGDVSVVLDITGLRLGDFSLHLHATTVTAGSVVFKSAKFASDVGITQDVFVRDVTKPLLLNGIDTFADPYDPIAESKLTAVGASKIGFRGAVSETPLNYLEITVTGADSANLVLTGFLLAEGTGARV